MINEMVGQVSMFDQDTSFGRTFAEQPQAESQKEKTLDACWKSWYGSSKKESLFLDLRRESGATPGSSSGETTLLHGGCQMPNIGAYRNADGGLLSLLTSTDTTHLKSYLERLNTTEAPSEVITSHLSEILEENPDPKYTLSSKACLGILNRASRRGKTLPPMLEEALIQMVVGGTEYGQEGIADTVEILRKMRCEIGAEALKEWVQRTFVLVQPEEVLLGEMCESVEDSEDSNEQIVVEGDSEEVDAEENVCEMRSSGEVGDTPYRQEPNEQLCRELNLLMQKLPLENAQKAVIVYCLRITCESEETVSEALSTVPQGKDDCIGVDVYNTQLTGGKACPLTAGGHTSTGTCPKVMTFELGTKTRYIVRRLTPNECEALQGYPQNWTNIGEYIDSTGKKRQTSDAARYKALGNSIALPPWKWVLKRLCACYERDATLGSLFDGLGGFPKIWEELNGKGSCLWASEVEEFCIAVTKKRIGD